MPTIINYDHHFDVLKWHQPELSVGVGDDRFDESTKLVRRQTELFAADSGIVVAAAAVAVFARIPGVKSLEILQMKLPVLLRNRGGVFFGIGTSKVSWPVKDCLKSEQCNTIQS